MKLRLIDLFTGLAGFSLAAEWTGRIEPVRFCEIDPFCRQVLAKHWPEVPCDEDITQAEFQEGEADIIAGGFPCQDVSLAGRRAGLAGKRSGLYRQLVRAIFVVRPLYAIMENVAALLSDGVGTVLGDLAEGGVDAEWDCVPAFTVGAPHERDRVWIVAHPHGFDRRPRTGREDGAQAGDGVEPSPDAPRERFGEARGLRHDEPTQWPAGSTETPSPSPHPPGQQVGSAGQSRIDGGLGPIAADAYGERSEGRRLSAVAIEGNGGAISNPTGDGCGQGRPWRPPDSFARVREQTRRYVADAYGTRLAFGEGVSRDARPKFSPAERGGVEDVRQSIWPDEPALSGVDDVIPDWLERTKATGNAILPKVATLIFEGVLDQIRSDPTHRPL